jgi:hypothetical protein
MDDESGNEMDSNHPLPSHHHIEPTLNDSRKRPNNQTGNYHPVLSMTDGIGQQTTQQQQQQQQNFLTGFFSSKIFIFIFSEKF